MIDICYVLYTKEIFDNNLHIEDKLNTVFTREIRFIKELGSPHSILFYEISFIKKTYKLCADTLFWTTLEYMPKYTVEEAINYYTKNRGYFQGLKYNI